MYKPARLNFAQKPLRSETSTPEWWDMMPGEPLSLILTPFVMPAYVGPGIAVGAVAVIFGFLFSVLLAAFTVVYYPLKRLFKRRKNNQAGAGAGADAA